MNSDNMKYVIRQSVERNLPRSVARDLKLPVGSGKVVGLAGVRRAGKTFLFFHAMQGLVESGVPRERMLYLNFEDDRLQPIREGDLDLVLRSFRELYPESCGEKVYLFLDEVQSAPGWELWARRLHDTENIEIFVTGSSSQLLSRDLSTALRGRSITLEVFPLSFGEFLAFRSIPVVESDADNESRLRAMLVEYLEWGGFPEIVLADEALRPLILEEYTSLMLYRDIVERYGVRNEKLMRELLRHAFRNTASLLNVSKLHRDLTSQGYQVSKNTLFEYLGYLEAAFLVFLLPIQEESIRKQAHNPKKMHVIDTGLISAFKTHPGRDMGRRLETAVFLQERRRCKSLFYYADSVEIDLCDEEGSKFINTCWDLANQEALDREVRAMEFGARRWPSATGQLVFHEYHPSALKQIQCSVPAWKILIGNSKV
jgi:predicted AAA+ superfamily ATPase